MKKFILQKLNEIEFPRIIICHGDGHGYDRTKVNEYGYDGFDNLIHGKSSNISSYGWVSSNVSTKVMFEQFYSKPFIESIILDSYIGNLNQNRKHNLTWIEIPMVYPDGRCLRLNFTKTIFTETKIVIKFHDIKDFNGSLEISITGKNAFTTKTM